MSTAAVSSSSLFNQLQEYFHTRQTDLHQLGKDLGTGDLAGAQAEFQDIAQLGQSGPFASGNPFSNPQREQDFTAIGQALQAGNLTAAQQAFSNLKATFENRVHDPLSPTPSGSGGGPEIVLNLGSASGSTSPEQITINIANQANGGEQISIGVGSQGSSAQQVIFNLPSNSNEELVLNLLGASAPAGSSSGSSSSAGLSVTA